MIIIVFIDCIYLILLNASNLSIISRNVFYKGKERFDQS
jgi:hypothetical protein